VPCARNPDLAQLACFLLEHLDEQFADDLALGLRIALAAQRIRKRSCGIHANHPHAKRCAKVSHDLIALAQTQQSVIDEYAGQLLADRPMQQRGHDRESTPPERPSSTCRRRPARARARSGPR
jgi:hypothetical protein